MKVPPNHKHGSQANKCFKFHFRLIGSYLIFRYSYYDFWLAYSCKVVFVIQVGQRNLGDVFQVGEQVDESRTRIRKLNFKFTAILRCKIFDRIFPSTGNLRPYITRFIERRMHT